MVITVIETWGSITKGFMPLSSSSTTLLQFKMSDKSKSSTFIPLFVDAFGICIDNLGQTFKNNVIHQ